MSRSPEPSREALIAEVVAIASTRLSGREADAAASFIRAFYRFAPAADLRNRSAEDLYAAALSLWTFGKRRPPGAPALRIHNPRNEEQGWRSSGAVLEVVNDDMPFLVDSVTAALNGLGVAARLVIHPILRTQRDSAGVLTALEPEAGGRAESFMQIETDSRADPAMRKRILESLTAVLADVRAAVEDFAAMKAALAESAKELAAAPVADADERAEAEAFLAWLAEDHFTFLGARAYRFRTQGETSEMAVEAGSGLGVLRNDQAMVLDGVRRAFSSLSAEAQAFMREPRLLMVTKSSQLATVHRRAYMDVIIVKTFDSAGNVAGERVFAGLFTSIAYAMSAREVPWLRVRVRRCLAQAGLDPRSHDGKALAHILDAFPRDELFQMSDAELLETAMGVLALAERPRTALFLRRDPFERFVSALVYVPRERYDARFRQRAARILESALNGEMTTYYLQLSEGLHARIQYVIRTRPGEIPAFEVGRIEQAIVEAARSWSDRLCALLTEARGETRGLELHQRYGGAFPTHYVEATPAESVIFDIERMEEALASGRVGLNLYRPAETEGRRIRFRLYNAGQPLPLSDVLPVLENMGLRVITEDAYRIAPAGENQRVSIHDFVMESGDGGPIDLDRVKHPFQEAFAGIWEGRLENDGFNRLILGAGLTGRQAALLRAYGKFLRQARSPFSQAAMENTLALYPEAARLAVDLFYALLDPDGVDREGRSAALLDQFERLLEGVPNLDDDRILRSFINLVRATLRTTYFQTGGEGEAKPYLALKLDSQAIDDLPLPRPMVEIFVYSPRMEAVHLRGGKIARGGLRWSDRREDFRTEVLGLMKAQVVKNAVIVPVGAKGGFVVKRPPPPEQGREAARAEGVACYTMMMRGMLDITDNLVEGAVIAPKQVVRRDDDDPYLVVAADKGTAGFSDIANDVAAEYGFWLGDAFASGGSAGYDHKAMGITARGAWESVKRHFRELGLDTQTEAFTVAGVGDMSGDVFGNGMLQSDTIRLIAAFNHLHIFVDPAPDPAASFAERKRLFERGRGSWDQYDPALLSPGGAVYDRKAKSVKLSVQAREALGVDAEILTPNQLISAILKAPVDLLWFGGIGAFIKGADESHAEVGDKANDPVRIDGDEVRARVIGEGANLGVTQLGRIDAARRNVRLNADFIDNSAGVDSSDHEVNLKILLNEVVAAGRLTVAQRNDLLADMTGDVAAHVLRNNYLQSQALSMAAAEASETLDQQARLMKRLERVGRLDRAVEHLPDDDAITERLSRKEGLCRPELAVLLSYAKIALYDEVLESGLPDDPSLATGLSAYFPPVIAERFPDFMRAHRLRRELIATAIVNSIVNRAGPTFISELGEKTGCASPDAARAYLIVRDSFDLRALWGEVEALDNRVEAALQTSMLLAAKKLLERAAAWVLRHVGDDLDIGRQVAHFRPGIALIEAGRERILYDRARDAVAERAGRLVAGGAPEALAMRVASLNVLAAGLELVRIADAADRPLSEAIARAYFHLGDRLGVAWLRDSAGRMTAATHWQKQATAAIVDDLYSVQADLMIGLLKGDPDRDPEAAVAAWLQRRQRPVERIDQLLAELRAHDPVDVSMLAIANRRLRGLAAGLG